MTPYKRFNIYEPNSVRKVFMGDNNMVEVVGKGFIVMEICVKGRVWNIRMFNVLYMPN